MQYNGFSLFIAYLFTFIERFIGSRLNDHTLDTLCLLRSFYQCKTVKANDGVTSQ
jgi:hypothetical protein